jgi:hypothetical protein
MSRPLATHRHSTRFAEAALAERDEELIGRSAADGLRGLQGERLEPSGFLVSKPSI